MKKITVLLLIFSCLFVLMSCKTEPAEDVPAEEHCIVSSAEELASALAGARSYIEFSADITWKKTTAYDSSNPLAGDVIVIGNNCTIDLNGHALKANAESAAGSFMIITFGSRTKVTIKNGTIDATPCSAIRGESDRGTLTLENITATSGKYFMVPNAQGNYTLKDCTVNNLNSNNAHGAALITSNNAAIRSSYLIENCTLTNKSANVIYLNDYDTSDKSVMSSLTVKNSTLSTDYTVCSCFTRYVSAIYAADCVFTGVKKVGYTQDCSVRVPNGITKEIIDYKEAKK